MRKTRKKILDLREISRCHPKHGKRSTAKRCLPSSVYSNLATKLKVSPNSVEQAVGCNPGEEHCVLDKAPLDDATKKQLRTEYLRPKRPKAWLTKPDTWLDNYNIMHVMKQYEEAYPWFQFRGVFPIDFSAPDPYNKTDKPKCLYNELCDLNLPVEYDKGIRGIGIIFNLDPHYKGGSHWVGLYINLKSKAKPIVSYFDSYGYKTPPLIARLMRSFKIQTPQCELGYNARRSQYSNTECGMYSMFFIVCMIQGISFKDFCKVSTKDETMLELRKIFFAL
jgi:hypothetical protein